MVSHPRAVEITSDKNIYNWLWTVNATPTPPVEYVYFHMI